MRGRANSFRLYGVSMKWKDHKIMAIRTGGFIASHLVKRLVTESAYLIEETISKWALVLEENRA